MVMSPCRTGRTKAPTAWRDSASARASASSVPLRMIISPRTRESPAARRIGGGADGAGTRLGETTWCIGAVGAGVSFGGGLAVTGAATAIGERVGADGDAGGVAGVAAAAP